MGVTKQIGLKMDYKYATYTTYFSPIFEAAPYFVRSTSMSTILPASLDDLGHVFCVLAGEVGNGDKKFWRIEDDNQKGYWASGNIHSQGCDLIDKQQIFNVCSSRSRFGTHMGL